MHYPQIAVTTYQENPTRYQMKPPFLTKPSGQQAVLRRNIKVTIGWPQNRLLPAPSSKSKKAFCHRKMQAAPKSFGG